MVVPGSLGVFAGAVALGAVHGVEPGHGWPVAATYALDRSNEFVAGFAASFILGVGHLISSLAIVAAFFYAKSYFELSRIDEPMTILGGVRIGGPVSVVAGLVLLGLAVREYTHGHSHGHGGSATDEDGSQEAAQATAGDDENPQLSVTNVSHPTDGHGHEHDHDDDHGHDDTAHAGGHEHPHDEPETGITARLRAAIPGLGGHEHAHADPDDAADRGLLGIAWFAFLLGFAHEEEFEIIALCAGSNVCLELMTAYALTVIVGIVSLTLLLIAGYQRYEQRVERFAPYLPAVSAAVLAIMGLGFVLGLF